MSIQSTLALDVAVRPPPGYIAARARLSDDGVYRYSLTRRWTNAAHRRLVVIGLNPSTADAAQDDPTIRRCVGFAKRERCGGLVMLNLYALRSTKPAAIWQHPDPVGPENDSEIVRLVGSGDVVLAAWGANARDANRVESVLRLLPPVLCLGTTKHGHPRHPLYVERSTPMQLWRR
jgi:hypothetical protein